MGAGMRAGRPAATWSREDLAAQPARSDTGECSAKSFVSGRVLHRDRLARRPGGLSQRPDKGAVQPSDRGVTGAPRRRAPRQFDRDVLSDLTATR